MTPREPDRFEAKAEQVAETWTAGHVALVDVVAAALRAAEAETLERAKVATRDAIEEWDGKHRVGNIYVVVWEAIRALASPAAAAPAAETCPFGGCVNDAPPSEPDAPAPDRCPFEEKDCLEARVLLHQCAKALRGVLAHAEWLDKHLGRLPNTDEENARTVLAKLAARTSPGAAGEGTT